MRYIVDDLGFDGGFNYKREKTEDALGRLAPEGLDIYYDNVGGEQLDGALWRINVGARIVVCGMVSPPTHFATDREVPYARETNADDGVCRG